MLRVFHPDFATTTQRWWVAMNDNSEAGHRARRYGALPPMLAPRGLNREAAAAYVGLSASKFDVLVVDRRMPRPKRVDGRRIWDRHALDSAFDALEDEDGRSDLVNPWHKPR